MNEPTPAHLRTTLTLRETAALTEAQRTERLALLLDGIARRLAAQSCTQTTVTAPQQTAA